MIRGLNCSPQGNECRRCEIYRFGSLCTQDIKHVVHEQSDYPDAGVAIRKLMQRRKPKTEKEN
jgi:hypothetical protein